MIGVIDMDKKTKPVPVEKQKYIKLAEEVQKIIAKEQATPHAN